MKTHDILMTLPSLERSATNAATLIRQAEQMQKTGREAVIAVLQQAQKVLRDNALSLLEGYVNVGDTFLLQGCIMRFNGTENISVCAAHSTNYDTKVPRDFNVNLIIQASTGHEFDNVQAFHAAGSTIADAMTKLVKSIEKQPEIKTRSTAYPVGYCYPQSKLVKRWLAQHSIVDEDGRNAHDWKHNAKAVWADLVHAGMDRISAIKLRPKRGSDLRAEVLAAAEIAKFKEFLIKRKIFCEEEAVGNATVFKLHMRMP